MSLLSPPNTQPLEYIGILKRKANTISNTNDPNFLYTQQGKIVTRYLKVLCILKYTMFYRYIHTKLMKN
jgi:hypothetical protein